MSLGSPKKRTTLKKRLFIAIKKKGTRNCAQLHEMYDGAMCFGINTAPTGAHDGSEESSRDLQCDCCKSECAHDEKSYLLQAGWNNNLCMKA